MKSLLTIIAVFIMILFSSCGKPQEEKGFTEMILPELSHIIDDYIRESTEKDHCNDSTFYLTVSFVRYKEKPTISITGCKWKPAISADEDTASNLRVILPQRLMEGYFIYQKNQWIFIYVNDKELLPMLKTFFPGAVLRHDKDFLKYAEWQTMIDTDLWLYSIEENNELNLARKIEF